MNKLYYLLDSASKTEFNPMFAPNKDVALRTLSSELKNFRENKLYSAIAVWSDSDLIELDLEKCSKVVIADFKKFFEMSATDAAELIKNATKQN